MNEKEELIRLKCKDWLYNNWVMAWGFFFPQIIESQKWQSIEKSKFLDIFENLLQSAGNPLRFLCKFGSIKVIEFTLRGHLPFKYTIKKLEKQ